jgi:cation:H+ antiporter
MSWSIALLIIAGLVFLVFGGELLVRGASRLAAILGVPPMVVGLTVVAFGTSTPELAVSLKAALGGNADIAIANVVGSNIFNIFFILGVSALISPLIIHHRMVTREVPIMIGSSVLLYLFSIGGVINRVEGMVLFAGIIAYTWWQVHYARVSRKEKMSMEKELADDVSAVKAEGGLSLPMSIGLIVVGLGIVMFGADWLVRGATDLAKSLGVSDTVIGLTIVAAGTSLPEVVASIMATIKGERDIAVGNVVGSNIYNILAIIGISGTVVPNGISVNTQMFSFDYPVMLGAALLCWPFFKSGKQLSRLEGGIFLFAYIMYTAYLVRSASGAA